MKSLIVFVFFALLVLLVSPSALTAPPASNSSVPGASASSSSVSNPAITQIPLSLAATQDAGYSTIARVTDDTRTLTPQAQQFLASLSYAAYQRSNAQIVVYVTNRATTPGAFKAMTKQVFSMQEGYLNNPKLVSVVLAPALRLISVQVGSAVPLSDAQIHVFIGQSHSDFATGHYNQAMLALVGGLSHYLQVHPTNAIPVSVHHPASDGSLDALQHRLAALGTQVSSFLRSHLPSSSSFALPVRPLFWGLLGLILLLLAGFTGLYFKLNGHQSPAPPFSPSSFPPSPVPASPASKGLP